MSNLGFREFWALVINAKMQRGWVRTIEGRAMLVSGHDGFIYATPGAVL